MSQAVICLAISTLLLLSALISVPAASHSDLTWKEQVNPHFTVYTQDKFICADQVARLESIRALFLKAPWAEGALRSHPRIILFVDEESFLRYRSNSGAAAFYKPVRGTDYIVMPQSQACLGRAVLHEYVHSVFHHIAPEIPLWLAEGLAEVYSAVDMEQGKLLMGTVLNEHLATLQTHPPNLGKVFSTVQGSLLYSDPKYTPEFYSASWAMTYMMLTAPEYADRFPQFLQAVRFGSTIAGLQTIYGKDVPAFTRDLTAYLRCAGRDSRLAEHVLNLAPLQHDHKEVSEMQMLCMLSELAVPGSTMEANVESRLKELLDTSDLNPKAEAALGFLAVRHNQTRDAYNHLRAAVLGGLDDPYVLLRCLELQQQSHYHDEMTSILLKRVTNVQPIDDNMRFRLGWISAANGEYGSAISLLSKIHDGSEQGFDCVYTLAYCFLRTRNWALSRSFGFRAQELARSIVEHEAATHLLQIVGTQLAAGQ